MGVKLALANKTMEKLYLFFEVLYNLQVLSSTTITWMDVLLQAFAKLHHTPCWLITLVVIVVLYS